MALKDQREFIKLLEKHGEVQRIKQEVDWNLEAGAILRRTYERSLPAPYFLKIKGYPSDKSAFGGTTASHKRVALAWGLPANSTYQELEEFYLKGRDHPIKPTHVKSGPCKEVVITGDKVNLFDFPAPMLHEGDGGRYLNTWHAVITKDPDTGWVNWGMYRSMIHTKNTMGGLFEPHQHIGYHYYQKYEARNKPMPFAIAIGPEPTCAMAACTFMPYFVAEVDVAGGLRKAPVDLVKCETNDLLVPATSEIVLEGEVPPYERVYEGPFGEYTGYRASPRDKRPVYHVKAITHRKNPILTMSCMGMPIDDCDGIMSITSGAEILAELRSKGQPVTGVNMPPECAELLLIVAVKTTEPNIAFRIASMVWTTQAGRTPSHVIVVQDDVDPCNLPQVMHALASKCHPWRGVNKIEHGVAHALAPWSSLHERLNRVSGKTWYDCTWPMDWDPSIAVPPRASFDNIYSKEVQQHVLKNWKKYGFKKE